MGSETWTYLIETSGNAAQLKEEVASLNWRGNLSVVTTFEEEIDALSNDPANKGMNLVLIVQFACVLISVVAGILLLQLISFSSRKRPKYFGRFSPFC